jgi:hypothetical protein
MYFGTGDSRDELFRERIRELVGDDIVVWVFY